MKKTVILGFLFAASLGANAASIHTGLINYWALDGNGEDSASDFVGSTSTFEDDLTAGGTMGTTTITSGGGLFGGAVDFERTAGTDGMLSAGTAGDTNLDGSEVTISLWANFDDQVGNWQTLVASGETTNYRISRRSNQNRLSASLGSGDAQGVTNQADINNGDWFHVLATSTNDGMGAFTTTLYVNGVEESATSGGAGILSTGNPLLIGNNADVPDRQWDGQIDDIGIWNRALSSEEIATIFTEGEAGTSLGSIVTIPEPTSALLLGLSSLMVTLRRRR